MYKLIVAGIVSMLFVGISVTVGQAEDDVKPKENVKTFMRLKLRHAQEVLEGLTVENYDQIAQGSQDISLLSLATQWQVLQTPEYVRRSHEFRHAAEAVTEAAKKRNLDGATLGYVNVMLKCVECHKYVRSERNARLDLPQKTLDASVVLPAK